MASSGADEETDKAPASKNAGSGRPLTTLAAEMKYRAVDDKTAHMERLLFDADDAAASEYLKDLVSAAGLRGAWSQMAKRMRHVQSEHAKLMAFASREALNKDYVTRPEYEAKVEEEHFYLFEDHRTRLETLEDEVRENVQATEILSNKVNVLDVKLEDELNRIKPELAAAHGWLKRLDQQCKVRHQEVVDAIKKVEEEAKQRDGDMYKEMKAIEGKLIREIATREVLGLEVERQKSFLAGDTLKMHIVDTCNDALQAYVNKEEMMTEVERSAEFLMQPVRDKLESLAKELKEKGDSLDAKDAYLEQCLDFTDTRLKNQDDLLADRIEELNQELQTKASEVKVDDLKGDMNYRLAEAEALCKKLQKDTTHKVQEVVTRTTEFQVILSDHEHALQHQAEEMLNRATKYEVAVQAEKLDKCALKDKVDADFKDVRHTLSWTSTKLEAMAYDKSFGGGAGGGGAPSRSGSRKPALSRGGGSTFSLNSRVSRVSGVPKSISQKLGASGTLDLSSRAQSKAPSERSEAEVSGDQEVEDEAGASTKQVELEKSTSRKSTGGLAPSSSPSPSSPSAKDPRLVEEDATRLIQEASLEDNAAVSDADGGSLDEEEDGDDRGRGLDLMELIQSLQDQIQQIQAQIAQEDFVSGTSSLLLLMHQQLECLAKAVMGLGRAVLRPVTDRTVAAGTSSPVPGLQSLPREERVEHSQELVHHLSSVLHWISHRKRPADWDPDQLTTCALRAIPPPGSDMSPKLPLPQKLSVSPKEARTRRLARLRSKAAANPGDDNMATESGGRASENSGGWRHRGFVARTHPTKDLTRPSSSAGSVDAILPGAFGTRLSPGSSTVSPPIMVSPPGDSRGSTAPPGQRASMMKQFNPFSVSTPMAGMEWHSSVGSTGEAEGHPSLEMSSSLQASMGEEISLPKLTPRSNSEARHVVSPTHDPAEEDDASQTLPTSTHPE
mmetsp:Transcript_28509/g.51564  ORF Transcript_28509/g.51564 Transcript_28509/m.51564 type:complete len:954 (-) Transcript_28509:97-2958(-)|eukprot:CAMPEP_0197626530 /NCGR_PEP_ID=MMETSP1338-20131121/5453_1 /TAXON_ID=43686 ORGANISM="Pelagodinium beii, Strain RCC1491" /NCGR_SAMPLE_ID=MMETSP1338 /ASSEMBLY_ACC=CAM_ASM_000754 /LENGTH=953 /DNA_ID=CAMNT_0043197071 /DNA_START=105 /DNA_END=2966 /DNA_ORIENTATION=-